MSPKTTKRIANAMRKLSDVSIQIINCGREAVKPEGKGLEHVIAGGKEDLPKTAADWHGIVRAYNGLDFGRSTFQAFAFGRWYVYVNAEEEMVDSVPTIEDVPDRVHELLDSSDMELAAERHSYIKKNFNESKMHRRWANAVREALEL